MSRSASAANVTKRGLWKMRALTLAVLATNVGLWVDLIPNLGEWWVDARRDVLILLAISALLISSVITSFTRLANEAAWPLLAACIVWFILTFGIWGGWLWGNTGLDQLFVLVLLISTAGSFRFRYQIRNSEKIAARRKTAADSLAKRKYLLRD
jgi:hypothetical protein